MAGRPGEVMRITVGSKDSDPTRASRMTPQLTTNVRKGSVSSWRTCR